AAIRRHNAYFSREIKAAITEGAGGGRVLFVAPKKLDSLPPGVHGMPQASSSAMNNITFLYARHTSELQGYLASLHLIPAADRPTLIIIDELHFYTSPQDCGDAATQMVNIARIISLAQESAEYCSSGSFNSDLQNNARSQCSVLVSWTQHTSNVLKSGVFEAFARDFCHHIWVVKMKNKGNGRDSAEYHLVEQCNNTCTISYSACYMSPVQYLILNQVTLEAEEAELLENSLIMEKK
ncbi:hypothetical protein OTU49_011698, partial [Cherax quadricarinatus]